ncbi:uncharacterized protein BCR38DRAFT_118775 [Pseudomassariella vexata]|uniref:Uncharacterized protein n=1 Tax=Pseudomassariella vexata TaxID=1141098 RepID=A0A1Y2DBA3_9PEZI|nr:uncharacterized protein BCR38DRAFT_118775 [Pseudomassariella vexata]ORY56424.1 hypothetical protein BCR38DRAFT_118775 [Pseudomassariella vexata]
MRSPIGTVPSCLSLVSSPLLVLAHGSQRTTTCGLDPRLPVSVVTAQGRVDVAGPHQNSQAVYAAPLQPHCGSIT